MRSPWLPVLAGLTAIILAVAVAPYVATVVVLSLAVACWLVWRFGARTGLWFLFVASIPFREALSIDIHGTASLFPSDLLLIGLFAEAAYRGELRRLWRSSVVFRIGLAILALSLLGLLTASRLFWGVASIYRIALQIAVFVVASSVVRSGRDATRTLVAVVVGLAPAVAYGFYQASLPFGTVLPDWSSYLVAYGPAGERSVRVFSTFDQPLRFSHYLTIGFGLSLGLALSNLRRAVKAALLVVGAAAAYCNVFTYSIAGTLGMLSAAGTMLALGRRWAAALLPVLIVLLLLLSPAALLNKASRILAGDTASVAARIVTYQQSLLVMRDRPFLGAGWGSVRSSMEYDHRITRASAVAFGAENYFLQRGVALGVPGLALYVALCVLFFRNLIRSRGSPATASWPGAAILVGGVAFYVQAQSFPAANVTSTYLLWLFFALAGRMVEEARRPAPAAVTGAASTEPMPASPKGSMEPKIPSRGPEPESKS